MMVNNVVVYILFIEKYYVGYYECRVYGKMFSPFPVIHKSVESA